MIANDRRRSKRELFPYNRRRSQTIAEPTVAIQRKCQMYTRVVLAGKIKANNVADIEEEILLQENLFLLLVLKRRQRQLQNRRKHQFWIRKIFMKRQDKSNFSLIFSQLLRLFVFVFEILTITVVNALILRNYVQCQPCLKQMSVAINEHSGFMA